MIKQECIGIPDVDNLVEFLLLQNFNSHRGVYSINFVIFNLASVASYWIACLVQELKLFSNQSSLIQSEATFHSVLFQIEMLVLSLKALSRSRRVIISPLSHQCCFRTCSRQLWRKPSNLIIDRVVSLNRFKFESFQVGKTR